jgi:hypothetical protein
MASPHAPDAPAGGKASAPVSQTALWFGLLAAPLAWSAQELVCYYLASRLCRLRAAGYGAELALRLSPSFLIVTIVTFLIALAGAWTAWSNWRKVRDVRRESNLHPREIHAERSRFMARCALIFNVGFLGAFVFMTSEFIVAPLCGT